MTGLLPLAARIDEVLISLASAREGRYVRQHLILHLKELFLTAMA